MLTDLVHISAADDLSEVSARRVGSDVLPELAVTALSGGTARRGAAAEGLVWRILRRGTYALLRSFITALTVYACRRLLEPPACPERFLAAVRAASASPSPRHAAE